MNADKVVVTGLSLNSAIGDNVITACAAARAGISRVSELPFMVFDPETGDTIPSKGCQSELCTKGFVGLARLYRLGIPAIYDLIDNSHISLAILGDTPIYLNVSDRFLLDSAAHQLDDSGFLPDTIQKDELNSILEEDCKDRLISLLESGSGVKFGSKVRLLFAGHDGIIRLIQMAVQEIRSGTIDRCIVGGIDSYVEASKLQRFHSVGLLFGPENNSGFIPGEAASLILLERIDAAKQRNAHIQAVIGPICSTYEPQHRFSASLPKGDALVTALQSALGQLGPSNREKQVVISDLNGDYWCAHEWGSALVKLKQYQLLSNVDMILPAESFGEVGAAEGAVAICVGSRAYVRNYAKAEITLIVTSSYDGHKAALVLTDPKRL